MTRLIRLVAFCLLSLLVVSLLPQQAVFAAAIVVNTLVDEDVNNGTCSLREAITAANTNAAYRGCSAGSGTDTITFSVNGIINLTGMLPIVRSNINFQGPGAANLTIRRNTGGNYRLMWIYDPNLTINISDLTWSNGRTIGAVCGGAGIYNSPGTTMTVTNSVFSFNHADCSGGGIFNAGILTVTNSTFSNNDGGFEGEGGALFNNYGGTMTVINSTFTSNQGRINGGAIHNHASTSIYNSTFSGNYAGDECPTCNPPVIASGGAITNYPGTLYIENSTLTANTGGGIVSQGTATLANSTVVFNTADLVGGIGNAAGTTFNIRNSIIAGNTQGTGGTDLYGVFTSQGYNIVGTLGIPGSSTITGTTTGNQVGVSMASINLSALQNNGGPTLTHIPLAGSIAINRGNPNFPSPPNPATDQRGVARVQNLRLDVGAVETNLPTANVNLLFDGAFSYGLTYWATFGDIYAQVNNGVLNIAHWPGTQDTGFYQYSPYSAPNGGTFSFSFDIGLSSSVFRTVNFVISDPLWQDVRNCFLTIPPNRPLARYEMRFRVLQDWSNIVVRGYVLQANGNPAVLLDNLDLRFVPGLAVSGNVQCPTIS